MCASVAGGIPIIKGLREGLTAIRIEWIAVIINGTSNFSLSEMRSTGATFAAALKDAQARGYAEADPTFDVEGIDAAHKLTIRSAIAFDMGGTTAKACMIEGGEPFRATEYEIGATASVGSRLLKGAGYLLRVRSIDVAEVGAGGGSLAVVDS